MNINIYRKPDEWSRATGLCVVIDVLRAFTTAAFAFGGGAKSITFVGTAEEAFELRKSNPSLILMGEENGLPIPGFHHDNSPYQIGQTDLKGQDLVQRTTAGTQGVVHCQNASHILVASFVVADATVNRIVELAPDTVSFIVTGKRNGDEDLALAEYLVERLKGNSPDLSPYLMRVRRSPEGGIFSDPSQPQYPRCDLDLAQQVSRFAFAMEVDKVRDCFVARPVPTEKNGEGILTLLTSDEDHIVKECLHACCDDLFCDDEFQTLMGCTQAEMETIWEDYPRNKCLPETQAIIPNALNTLLFYPHAGHSNATAWQHHISASMREVRKIADKLNGIYCGPEVYDKATLIHHLEQGWPVSYLFFWGHQQRQDGLLGKGCFSQWYPSYFVVENVAYPTAEHYMMAEKARLFGDTEALEQILTAPTPQEAKRLGRQIRGFDELAWRSKRFDIIVAGNRAKFSQNSKMGEFLSSTRGAVLVEASPTDEVWGIGHDEAHPHARDPRKWRGLNLLGFALMTVRDM